MTPEGKVAKDCRDLMTLHNIDWRKSHVMKGMYKGYRVSTGKKGRADDDFLMDDGSGRTCYVEYKKPGGIQSPEQIEFMGKCKDLNIPYILTDNVVDFKNKLIDIEVLS
ncbi:MAG: hypothetical protein GY804_04560 [Alphaproteobacteria bacterium]|nr:hypothetical protein [Alphaproteobacteria bacterium]